VAGVRGRARRLQYLEKYHRLVIVSDIDAAGSSVLIASLPVEFDATLVAGDTESSK
jgi:hypothetical protein